MNRQEFTSTNSYPLSTQTMDLLQKSIAAVAELSRIGGTNYILSGCVQTGSSVSDGVIVINGEPMPFKGGAMLSTITVIETAETITANGTSYQNARISRYAQFASGTGNSYLPWSNFKPLPTNQQLNSTITAVNAAVVAVNTAVTKLTPSIVPKGVIAMWSGSVAPAGWALCDGRNNTPDLTGKFIVGAKGNNFPLGGHGGDPSVTLKLENMPSHNHYSTCGANNDAGGRGTDDAPFSYNDSRGSWNVYTSYEGGVGGTNGNKATYTEPFSILPPYYVLAYIMKL